MGLTKPGDGPSVALAHDYLTQRGGAERVAALLASGFPTSPLHTSVYEPSQTFPIFESIDVHTSRLQSIGPLRRDPRLALPLLAPAFSSMHLEADVVVASSSGWAHGVGTDAPVIVYCHAPARWLYQRDRYQGKSASAGTFSALATAAGAALGPALRRWDQRAAGRAAHYVVNSRAIAAMVALVYGIEAEVLSPPPALDPSGPSTPIERLDPGFVLSVSRLLPYKNVPVTFEVARRRPDLTFVLVGDGPLRSHLEAERPANLRMVASVSDAELRWLYTNASVLLAPSFEDFGLTPLEAAACGTSTLALRAGGYLDTIVDGVTGRFFDELSPSVLSPILDEMIDDPPPPARLQAHAATFSAGTFVNRMHELVAEFSPVP